MNSIVIADQDSFRDFLDGKVVEQTVICPEDHLDDFKDEKLVEVWFKGTSKENPHYIGKIVNYLGQVPSLPAEKPEVIKVSLRKANAKELA